MFRPAQPCADSAALWVLCCYGKVSTEFDKVDADMRNIIEEARVILPARAAAHRPAKRAGALLKRTRCRLMGIDEEPPRFLTVVW
jgi:hypothetical protein